MGPRVNAPLLDLIQAYLREHYLPPRWRHRPVPFFAQGAALVSAAFTSERGERPKNYFNLPEFRSGYLLYFLASNLPKVEQCLRLVQPAQRFAGQATVRMLDLGCGPGTAALAAAQFWQTACPGQALEILGIDQNREILKDARGLFTTAQFRQARFTSRCDEISPKHLAIGLRKQRFDLILCTNLLNELGPLTVRQQVVQHLLRHHLSERGVLIIIEPALQQTTRELMQLRDDLLDATPVPILAPCLHQASCPMLRHNARDWCHAYLDWRRPPLIAQVDQLIGNKKDFLKFSYLILGQPLPAAPHTTPSPAARYRVVSAPMRSKGKTELLLCPDATGDTSRLHRIARLSKDRTARNTALERAWRGDLVVVSKLGRLGRDDECRIVERFRPPR